jgi:PIN domain nuclease of toxin-antitoxin system
MRTLLDAYALVALTLDEPAAEDVVRLLREGEAAVTSVNYGEALDQLIRAQGLPELRVLGALEPLLDGPLARVDVGFGIVISAVRLRATHYHRKRSLLSLADCVCLAAAGADGAVATADEAMLRAAESEGIATVRLGRASQARRRSKPRTSARSSGSSTNA